MANIFMMNEEIARGMVCFFHQKKHSYLILFVNQDDRHLLAHAMASDFSVARQ
jgi:uncharacterized protein YlbG (UPF0298 family)